MRISDWSSDVCSSDLDRESLARKIPGCARRAPDTGTAAGHLYGGAPRQFGLLRLKPVGQRTDRRRVVWGKSVSVRVVPVGGRIFKKKKRGIAYRQHNDDH